MTASAGSQVQFASEDVFGAFESSVSGCRASSTSVMRQVYRLSLTLPPLLLRHVLAQKNRVSQRTAHLGAVHVSSSAATVQRSPPSLPFAPSLPRQWICRGVPSSEFRQMSAERSCRKSGCHRSFEPKAVPQRRVRRSSIVVCTKHALAAVSAMPETLRIPAIGQLKAR